MSYHNLLSKTARACATYLVQSAAANAPQGQQPFIDETTVFPVKFSLDKTVNNGLVICDCVRWVRDDANPGRYLVETRIVCKTPGSIQPQNAGPQSERLASEQFVAQVFDLIFTDIVDADNTQLADNITSAARTLAAAEPDTNGDLNLFKCDEVVFEGGSGDASSDGTFWEDVLNLTLYVRATNATEPIEPN